MHVPIRRRTERPMVREYGCTVCQAWHCRETEPALYEAHLYHQSKHGWRERPATPGEMFVIEMEKQ